LAPPRLCRARRAEVRAEQAEDLANELRGRLDIAGKAADQARAEAHEAHQVAGALRQAGCYASGPRAVGTSQGGVAGGVTMEPKLNLFAMAGLTNGIGDHAQVSLTLATAIVIALVIFMTAFVLGLMCGWAWWRRRA
jgi:hypothetical protein